MQYMVYLCSVKLNEKFEFKVFSILTRNFVLMPFINLNPQNSYINYLTKVHMRYEADRIIAI